MKKDINFNHKTDKNSNEKNNESNSSSLCSYEEMNLKKEKIKEETKDNNKKNNIFANIIKNEEWSNIIKLKEVKKVENTKQNNDNDINEFNIDELIDDIEQNKQIRMNRALSLGRKKNNIEMTPSLKSNSKFFQLKFGKSVIYNDINNTNKNTRKSCNIVNPMMNDNKRNNEFSPFKNYYTIIKEINKLIKYINNAQQIFSKKTIKITLTDDEKKLLRTKSIKKRRKSINKNQKDTRKIIFQINEEKSNNSNKNNISDKDYSNNNDSVLEKNNLYENEINIMELIVEIFKKSSGLRNKDELFFIEHYLMTFENVMKILQQKTIGSAGNDLAKKIARYMQIDIIPENIVICKLGDIGDKFYVIFQGNVAILIPKETNVKMDINEYFKHLNKLFDLGEYELALKTIESNLHIYKNKDIIYLKSYVEKYLNIPGYARYKRENLSIKEYMERIEFDILNENNENNIVITDKDASPIHNPIKELDANNHIPNSENKDNLLRKTTRNPSLINKSFNRRASSLSPKNVLDLKKHVNFKSTKNILFSEDKALNKKNNYKKSKFTTMALPLTKGENLENIDNKIKSSKINIIHEESYINYSENELNQQNKGKKSTFNSMKKVISQEGNTSSSFFQNSNKNNEESNDKDKDAKAKKHNVILWSYFHVTNLIDGQTFGDVALAENNKKRTATIITQEKTICGTLDYYIYNKFIKDAQKKIRKNIVHYLLNVNFFRGINEDIFEEQYFNMFKYNNLHRNDYLFKSNHERNSIYIVVSGEIEASINCTIQELNNILNNKNVILHNAINFEERLCIINENFNYFYKNSKNIYRIKIHAFGSCLGLNEYVLSKEDNENSENKSDKDIFYVNAKCISDKAEVYSIDYKLLKNIFKSEKREKRFNEIMKESERKTLLRIIQIKKNIIIERFDNLCDKFYFDNYLNLKYDFEENKDSQESFILNTFDNSKNSYSRERKRIKTFNIEVNNAHSSYINRINKKNFDKNISLNKDKIIKQSIKLIKSNSSSKTSKIPFDDILDNLEKDKNKDIEKNKNIRKNKIIINIYDNNKSKETTKSQYIDELEKDSNDNSFNFKNITNLSCISKENNKNIQYLSKIKEIYFDENTIISNDKQKKNILNKKNKKIILYPILHKKPKAKLTTLTTTIPFGNQNYKIKNMKKNLSHDKLMKHKEDTNIYKSNNSIFSLILNGLPTFNNKYLSQNIKGIPKKCDYFKNAKLIDKNLLKLPKEKSFFYKGCESLLTMNNNIYNNKIPIIDLLKYDKIYEKNYIFKKRNNSAINKTKINMNNLY